MIITKRLTNRYWRFSTKHASLGLCPETKTNGEKGDSFFSAQSYTSVLDHSHHMNFDMVGRCCTYLGVSTMSLVRKWSNSELTKGRRCTGLGGWELWLLSDLILCYRTSLCWNWRGENTEQQSFTLFQPLLLLLLLILDHPCCPDPDYNLGGWCYRKPDAPGKIELLHGDSSLFTSSLTGCLKMKNREGGGCGVSWLGK